MKRITTYLLAALLLIASGCDDNIPKTGTVNNALVEQVVFDEVLSEGLVITVGSTCSLPEHISALPIDATNTAQRYESSDPSVADVSDSGILTANKIGECIITVYVGTDGICGEFPVEVTRMPYIHISSLRFNSSEEEYDIVTGTVNLKSSLYVGSESLTEDATEPVLFDSSDENVASIDANGILTIHSLGQTTVTASAEESAISPATIVIRIYKWIEYERFPGDRDGQQRTIMGTSASEWNALPHTDNGWEMTEFGWLNDASHKDGWANTGQRNSYRYAMLDNRQIVARGGAANNLPTATNGTAFCYQRPGGNQQAKETDGVYFIIDMKQPQVVTYFRTVNISDNADDRGIRLTRVSVIYGSNDSSTWTEIASGIEDWNPRIEANGTTTYPLESQKAMFENGTAYRYIKFVMNPKDRCYGYFNNPSDTNSDRDGNAIQVAELYMGCKAYSED